MRIIVIAATKTEIEPLLAENKGIETLITGIGVPATMYALQKKFQQTHFDLVIQAGISGAFSQDTGLGKVVLVKQDTFADIGMEEKEKFTGIFQSGFADKDAFPFTDGWLLNPYPLFTQSNLPAVKAITINKISDSLLQQQQLIGNFLPDIESMEGAALHYVCLQEKVPFLQIRGISNLVGERDRSKWKIREAILNLNREVKQVIAFTTSIKNQ